MERNNNTFIRQENEINEQAAYLWKESIITPLYMKKIGINNKRQLNGNIMITFLNVKNMK